MRFFLPKRLVELEYLDSEPDEEYEEIAKPYHNEIDFAFFVVNFGYSKRDYEELTPREKHFIMKAWENKMITDSYNSYNASFTAFYNANRPKRKKALKLWKKKTIRIADKDVVQDHISIAKNVERKEGKSWIELLFRKNGIKKEVE